MRLRFLLLASALAPFAAVPAAHADAQADFRICVTMPIANGDENVFAAIENSCSGAVQSALITGDEKGRAYARRGMALLYRGDNQGALDDFERATGFWPASAEALYGRGIAKIRLGDEAGGRADMAKAEGYDSDISDDFAAAGVTP